ncbi:hypothetical protein P7C73_g2336, partial [Tremellales sp. Uapishka_1]
MSPRIAVIIGAGPGLGAALAASLGATHSLLLMSRSLPGSLPGLHLPSSIPPANVLACSSDGSASSLKSAMEAMKQKWPDGKVDVGIYNVGGRFSPGPFLERTEAELRDNLDAFVVSGFNFAQAVLPRMLEHGQGTLIFTGATMAMRGGANFSSMAPGMFGRRALSQSLAREFGPKGIHVAHVIVDGGIDSEKARAMMGEGEEGTRLKPEDIAFTYQALINQPRSAWTQELDLRPMHEKW